MKINDCCETICDWSVRVQRSWQGWPDADAILSPVVFDIADLYGAMDETAIKESG